MGSAPNLRVLISREQIAARVTELAKDIEQEFAGEAITLVTVLQGAATFARELAHHLHPEPLQDSIGVTSYGAETKSNRQPRLAIALGFGAITGYADRVLQRLRMQMMCEFSGECCRPLQHRHKRNCFARELLLYILCKFRHARRDLLARN